MTTRDRVGLYLQDVFSLQDSIRFVQYAETRGFDAVWQAESRLARDVIVPIAAYAAVTHHIKIGSAVMNIWTRNVTTIASTFLTLDDIAPDRILCGLGDWWEPLATNVGIHRRKPLLAMREVVESTRALLARQVVTFPGQFVHLKDIQLDVIYGRREARDVPIYIGATGPKMMALAGQIADGVLLNYLVSPSYTEGALAQLEVGAKQGGRALESIDRPQLIACALDDDNPQRAIDVARRVVTLYIRQQPQVMLASGVPQALIDDIAQVLPLPATDEQIHDVMSLVPDEIVQLVTASGDARTVRSKVREYIDAGATYPVLYPLCDDVHKLIDVFASGYSV